MMTNTKSRLYLMGACITAIAAVGSIFELASGKPDLGIVTTSIIFTLTLPITGWLFYIAVTTANQE